MWDLTGIMAGLLRPEIFSQQIAQLLPALPLLRLPIAAEDAGSVRSSQRGAVTFHPDPRAFPDAHHRDLVLLVELLDPLLAGLSHVGRARVGVDVVRVDLEG